MINGWHAYEAEPDVWRLAFRNRCLNDGGTPLAFARKLDVELAIRSLLEVGLTSPTKVFAYQKRHGGTATKYLIYRYLQW